MGSRVSLQRSGDSVSHKSDGVQASRVASRRLSVRVAQSTTKTLSPPHGSHVATDDRLGGHPLMIQSLMVALLMRMRQRVMHGIMPRVFAEEDHPVQHCLVDRAHKSLTMGVHIGRLRRSHCGLYTAGFPQRVACVGALTLSVMDERA